MDANNFQRENANQYNAGTTIHNIGKNPTNQNADTMNFTCKKYRLS